MKNKIIGGYSILVATCVIIMWTFILSGKVLPEGKTELSFHLTAEFLMAPLCLSSGVFLLRKRPGAEKFSILGLGMLLYSVLNAAGYYAERKETGMVIMFIILLVFTTIALMWQTGRLNKDDKHISF